MTLIPVTQADRELFIALNNYGPDTMAPILNGLCDNWHGLQTIATYRHTITQALLSDEAVEASVMVCPQCEGEGSYADGMDEAACSTECTRCKSNGWIVDLAAIQAAIERTEG